MRTMSGLTLVAMGLSDSFTSFLSYTYARENRGCHGPGSFAFFEGLSGAIAMAAKGVYLRFERLYPHSR